MPNTLTNIVDKILARSLTALREQAVMPRIVNTDYGEEAARFGNTIEIPKPQAQVVSTMVPGIQGSAVPANVTNDKLEINLDQWKITDFHMTDKEMVEVDRSLNFIPGQTQEAVRAIANDMDIAIHNLYVGVTNFIGTEGVIPFSTIQTALDARKTLNTSLIPEGQRSIVLAPDGEAQALSLSAYSDADKTGDDGKTKGRRVKIDGLIGRKFGFDHFMSQNVVTHTAGTQASAIIDAQVAVGSSTLTITDAKSVEGTVVVGDVFTIAGHSQNYVSRSLVTVNSSVAVTLEIAPTLQQIASTGATLTFKRSHVVNLAFHKNAFAFVNRPMVTPKLGGEVFSRTLTDPLTGLTMRLETIRQRKQTAWEFDALYGVKLVQPGFAVRIAG